jgi:hypothetical protein
MRQVDDFPRLRPNVSLPGIRADAETPTTDFRDCTIHQVADFALLFYYVFFL